MQPILGEAMKVGDLVILTNSFYTNIKDGAVGIVVGCYCEVGGLYNVRFSQGTWAIPIRELKLLTTDKKCP